MSFSLIRVMSAGLLCFVGIFVGTGAAAQFEPVDPAPTQPQQPPQQAPQQPQPQPQQPSYGQLPEVVATINDEPVPRELFAQALEATRRRLLSNPQAQQQGVTQLSPDQQRMVLESIISNRIALMLAEEADIEVDEAEVEEFVEREEARFPSADVFENFLRNEGIDRDTMRHRTREILRIQAFREMLTEDVSVSEEELRTQYETLRDDGRLNAPKTWDFRHILVKVDPHDPDSHDEAEEKIEAVRARIAAGEDFATVAEEVSDDLNSREAGGLYRNVPRGRGLFDEEFEETALAVPAGEMSEPFSTRMGWHLVYMEEVHEAGLMSYERVAESLENQLLSQRQQAAFQERLMEKRDDFEVEVFVNFGRPGGQPQQPGGSAIDDLLRQLDEDS